MLDFFERLDKFFKYKELNDNKVTLQAGISNGIIGKGRKRGSLSLDNISKILYTYPELNANWLLTGTGEMVNIPDGAMILNPHVLKSDNAVDRQSIPLYSVEATAGLVNLFDSNQTPSVIDTIKIPNLPKCDGAVFVMGDSMYPLLKSGDIVAYKQIQNFKDGMFWGEMYLISVEVDGEEYVSVKFVQKSDLGDDYIKLVSQNTYHQPKDIHLSKVRALAIVKASIRLNSMS
ncbi:transcriptional regulator [Fulvitalea axinellae]|uniref:Transcriptional regulator n=1 Tax=Fulvitalea axinellae TaxID=1182444 RepID=A0AAU9CFF9_9BACT|nr:transcriptional regulator [Fulvitalea axinellae]